MSLRALLASCALGLAALPAFATETVATPEPATMLLVGGGLAATILIARKRRK